MLEKQSITLLDEALDSLEQGFSQMPEFETGVDLPAMREVLLEVAQRMQDNFPYPHPLYAGQMLKPPHPMARIAYMLALWFNPNNHALDGGRASSAMEKEAVAEIATMFGWGDCYLGHLSSAGTTANLEALWVAGRLHPGKTIVASSQAHYTHARITDVLSLPFEALPVDQRARIDPQALEALLQGGNVGTVVATLGTTGSGSIDPLEDILELRRRYDFRIHVDAAYGGYFKLVNNLEPEAAAAYACIDQVDSIVVDPHKHGLQPYGCGCILFRDRSVGQIYKHDSPYTYFSSGDLHLGEISLECSRAGASAVALWATQRLLPLVRGGSFAQGLEQSREAALDLYRRLVADPRELTLFEPQMDIVLWAPAAQKASVISTLSRQAFDNAARLHLHLALMEAPSSLLQTYWPEVEFDTQTVVCLRSCLMKPEHNDWLGEIWKTYRASRDG